MSATDERRDYPAVGVYPIYGELTRWRVFSGSRPGVAFIVDSDYQGRWACGCEHWMVNETECRHIRLVKQFATSQNR